VLGLSFGALHPRMDCIPSWRKAALRARVLAVAALVDSHFERARQAATVGMLRRHCTTAHGQDVFGLSALHLGIRCASLNVRLFNYPKYHRGTRSTHTGPLPYAVCRTHPLAVACAATADRPGKARRRTASE
jgi:hypothetical protein